MQALSDSAIERVRDSVFAQPDFNGYSLWEHFLAWLHDRIVHLEALLSQLFAGSHHSPLLFWSLTAVLTLLLLAVAARAGYLWYGGTPRGVRGARARRGRGAGRHADPWVTAQEFAAAGDYTAGAHALYAATLDAAEARREIRIHSSKTAGDYAREVRTRAPERFPGFREFARLYESVIYGVGRCDGLLFDRLRSLALPLVRPSE